MSVVHTSLGCATVKFLSSTFSATGKACRSVGRCAKPLRSFSTDGVCFHQLFHPFVVNHFSVAAQEPINLRTAVKTATLRVKGFDFHQQTVVLRRSLSRLTTSPCVIARCFDHKHPTHQADVKLCFMLKDESVLYRMSLAKYAAAFFRIARSSSSCLTFCRNSKFSCSKGGCCP